MKLCQMCEKKEAKFEFLGKHNGMKCKASFCVGCTEWARNLAPHLGFEILKGDPLVEDYDMIITEL